MTDEKKDSPVALKYDGEKPKHGLISSIFLTFLAQVLTFGAKKYAAHNWRKGFNSSRLYDSIQRHLVAWNEGEDMDPESGLPHLAHAACGLMFLIEQMQTKPHLDDRYIQRLEHLGRHGSLKQFHDLKKEELGRLQSFKKESPEIETKSYGTRIPGKKREEEECNYCPGECQECLTCSECECK